MTNYDIYNREERAICSHLFRLLHESLDEKSESPFGKFIKHIYDRTDAFRKPNETLEYPDFKNIGIYTEVAIIRDHYHVERSAPNDFMDKLVTLIMQQESVTSDCRLYSKLDALLNTPWETHPKQIKLKASQKNIHLSENESKVYGALQGMFNAKPDLALTIDNKLIVIEAKFTESFDEEQLKRTQKIAQVWAELLYKDLGFPIKPEYAIIKLGASKFSPDINWGDILEIAKDYYPPNDKSLIAFTLGQDLLQKLNKKNS